MCKWHTAAAQKLSTRCSFLYNCKAPWSCTIWWKEGHTEMVYMREAWTRSTVVFFVCLFLRLPRLSKYRILYSIEALDFHCKLSSSLWKKWIFRKKTLPSLLELKGEVNSSIGFTAVYFLRQIQKIFPLFCRRGKLVWFLHPQKGMHFQFWNCSSSCVPHPQCLSFTLVRAYLTFRGWGLNMALSTDVPIVLWRIEGRCSYN